MIRLAPKNPSTGNAHTLSFLAIPALVMAAASEAEIIRGKGWIRCREAAAVIGVSRKPGILYRSDFNVVKKPKHTLTLKRYSGKRTYVYKIVRLYPWKTGAKNRQLNILPCTIRSL